MFTPKVDRISYGGAIISFEEVLAVMNCMLTQGGTRWTMGENSVALERELAETFGVRRSVLTNSGSSALLVALTSLHLPKGSKVIVPAVNFPTAFNAILQCGCIPVVVDVDLKTLNIDIKEVEKAISMNPEVKAIFAVHIAANPVDLIELRKIVGDRYIISDNCDGSGTTFRGSYIDGYADLSCVSFHAAHIITMGEGGAVLTSNVELADRCLKLREWGRASGTDEIYEYEGFPEDYRARYVYEEIGFNMKPLELQCAMGRVQLKKMLTFKEARKKNYQALKEIFSTLPQFKTIESIPDSDPCWFSFPILCDEIKRKKVFEAFEGNNIECRTIFSGNILRHPAYKKTEHIQVGSLKNADYVMANGMFLSVHPSITPEMIKFIGEVAREVCAY